MTINSNRAFFDYLLAEYNQPFNGWDFSYLQGRKVELAREKSWDYTDAVVAAMRQASALLDMCTGGGEKLARFLSIQPVPRVYATEGYAPNVLKARQLLTPLGVTVYEVQDEVLPFKDDTLDLIINRHGSYDPDEVQRVLKSEGIFITQQVGDQTNLRLHELLGHTKQQPVWNLENAIRELVKAGWQIVEQQEAFFTTRFYDVGAIVYYLKAVAWEVPDFSVEKYFDKLVEIQQIVQQEGFVDIRFHSFFIVASVKS